MFEESIRQAIYDALAGEIMLGNAVVPVYDDVPQPVDGGVSSAFPYVVIGDTTYAPWDTDTEQGAEATITIHTWSRYSGRREVMLIHDEIYRLLHRVDIQVDCSHTVGCDFEQSDSFLDSDGETRHGVTRYRLIVDQKILPEYFRTADGLNFTTADCEALRPL
jgi:hypothetical protein